MVRWGIVTAGKISNNFVNAINSYPDKDIVVTAVAARDIDRATEFAKKHNIPLVFESYQALAVSDAFDVAYIGALNPDHYKLGKLFVDNGKHVLIEKPLCMNFKQAKSLIDLAKKKKVFFMEAVWSRFSPAYIALEKEVQSGNLGKVKLVQANIGMLVEKLDRVSKKNLGGGALLCIGIYALQFAQYVFKDEPVKVMAIGNLNNEGVDQDATIILEYAGGRKAVLNIDTKIMLQNDGSVYGTKGQASVVPIFFPTKITYKEGKIEEFHLHKSPIPYYVSNIAAGLVYEALEVARCIREGLLESPRMTHEDSLNLAKLEDTIRKQIGVHYDEDDSEYL